MPTEDTLLPADPQRGLTAHDVADAEADYDGSSFGYGMWSAVGAARVRALTEAVRTVLRAGLGRDVALLTLLGGCARLDRDELGEYSDTVVRESIRCDLELDCQEAGVAPFTDAELAEVSVLLSVRALAAYQRAASGR